jgi:hypothetical protein
MTNKKQQLIANAFEEVKKNLSISDSNPKERLNKFQKKLDATEPNVIFRLKAVWQVLIALMVSFFTIGFMMAKLSLTSGVVIQYAVLDEHEFNMYDADMNGKLDFAEAQAAREMLAFEQFQSLDKNRDALLSASESQTTLVSLLESKCAMGNKEACSMSTDNGLKMIDMDQNQHICYKEFLSNIAVIDSNRFSYLDQNKDGELDFKEATHLSLS